MSKLIVVLLFLLIACQNRVELKNGKMGICKDEVSVVVVDSSAYWMEDTKALREIYSKYLNGDSARCFKADVIISGAVESFGDYGHLEKYSKRIYPDLIQIKRIVK